MLAVMAVVLAVPGTAFAHVEITAANPPGADNVVLTSVVAENECAGAQATLQLVFPETPEFTVATPAVTEGWTSVVEKRSGSEAIAGVTWSNGAGAAGDGTFQLAVGPIAVDQEPMTFKALETCADGEIFRWIEEGTTGEFPSPILTLDHSGHSTGSDDHAGGDDPVVDQSGDQSSDSATAKKSDDESSIGVIIGVVAAVVALGVGAYVLSRRKKIAA